MKDFAGNLPARSPSLTLATVPIPPEAEMDLQYSTLKGVAEATFPRILPLLVGNPEAQIFVRGASVKADNAGLVALWLHFVVGGCLLVDQIRVENLS